MDITSRLNNLSLRRSDKALLAEKSYETFSKSFSQARQDDSALLAEKDKWTKYVLDSMAEVPRRSTEISFEEGEKVKKHLKDNLMNHGLSVEFRFQGSVINNTHIMIFKQFFII